MPEKTYDTILNALNEVKKAFAVAAVNLYDALYEEITEGKADQIDIEPLNNEFPQLHVTHQDNSCLVNAFFYEGTISADNGYNQYTDMYIDCDIEEDSIIDTINYLRGLKKEIEKGFIVKKFDEEERTLNLCYAK